MKTVILCGGLGTRLREHTETRPKPMVGIGGSPILWHIMKIYSHFGFNHFVLALGYRSEIIKDFFINYYPLSSDITVALKTGKVEVANVHRLDWTIQMVDTGRNSMTGGRLRRLADQLRDGGTFMLTYGDGVAPVDVVGLLEFHRQHGKLATVTAVRPPARFGDLDLDGPHVVEFKEKPQTGGGWINGGFFVFEPGVLDYIEGDHIELERGPLESLARDGELMAFRHHGFWHGMDTVRDLELLEQLWQSPDCPWKVWSD